MVEKSAFQTLWGKREAGENAALGVPACMAKIQPDRAGLKRPLPALKTRRVPGRLKGGDRLEACCTDRHAAIDAPILLAKRVIASRTSGGREAGLPSRSSGRQGHESGSTIGFGFASFGVLHDGLYAQQEPVAVGEEESLCTIVEVPMWLPIR